MFLFSRASSAKPKGNAQSHSPIALRRHSVYRWIIRFIQSLFALLYVALIIITIPLAFDVGGHDCGLAFTFTLSVYYFIMSTIRILSRNTRLSWLGSLLYYSQHVIIPSLLIVHLSWFSDPSSSASGATLPLSSSSPIWMKILIPWHYVISHATPWFTILEGLCTLLVIQATGQSVRRHIRRSDTWLLIQLVLSACVLTGSIYVLYRVYSFPAAITIGSATLIGVVLTTAVFLGLYGIVSRKGTAIESSLIFAYVVYYLYVTYSDFQSANSLSSLLPSFLFPPSPSHVANQPLHHTPTSSSDPVGSHIGSVVSHVGHMGRVAAFDWFPFFRGVSEPSASYTVDPHSCTHQVSGGSLAGSRGSVIPETAFPPTLVSGYANLVSMVAERIPEGFITIYKFLAAISSTVTPSVAITLSYRLFVFYMATRIIPEIKHQSINQPKPHLQNHHNNHHETGTRRVSKSQPVLFIIYSYAPCLIIAVYTHLLVQHAALFGPDSPSSSASIWCQNLSTILYELLLGTSIDSWKFWGWVNIFSALALYALELASSDSQVIDSHFKTD